MDSNPGSQISLWETLPAELHLICVSALASIKNQTGSLARLEKPWVTDPIASIHAAKLVRTGRTTSFSLNSEQKPADF